MAKTNEKLMISATDNAVIYECNLYDSISDFTDNAALPFSNGAGQIRYVGITDNSSHPYITNCHVNDGAGNTRRLVTTPYWTHTVTVVQPTNGTIYVNGQIGTSFTFSRGTQVTVQLVPTTGYNAILTVGGANVANAYTWNIADTTTVTGKTTIQTFTLTITQPANGYITINGSTSTRQTFNYGTRVTIQAVPNSGHKVDWLDVT